MRRARSPFASIGLACLLAASPLACSHGEPPTWDGGVLWIAPLPALPASVASSAADAAVDAPHEASAPVDPGTLPQTRDRPRDDAAFQARSHALWDAIAQDNADLALPAFFPLSAYKQVKAIPNPEADWKRRLVAAFRRDVHKLHEKLGSHAADAKLLELDIATERAHWVEPGEEGNKLGYWRVFGSKLRYETDRGTGALDVSSLISWRGEWYVVHLAGFK